MNRLLVCALIAGSLTAGVRAQSPGFRWQAGDVMDYSVRQTTTVRQMVPGPEGTEPVEGQTVTRLSLMKRWQVTGVDEAGVATVRLTLPALRMELLAGDAMPIIFDSADPAGSDGELSKEMARYVNAPLAEIRLDGRGRLIEVKSSEFGPASRLEADLPFKVVFPESPTNGPWTREYVIKLDPPQGAGETFEAVQTYAPAGENGSLMTLTLKTELKTKPTADEEIPLLPFLNEGEVYFDTATGRYHGSKLRTEAEVIGHRGEGSKYRYESSYVEAAVRAR